MAYDVAQGTPDRGQNGVMIRVVMWIVRLSMELGFPGRANNMMCMCVHVSVLVIQGAMKGVTC